MNTTERQQMIAAFRTAYADMRVDLAEAQRRGHEPPVTTGGIHSVHDALRAAEWLQEHHLIGCGR